MKRSRQRLNSDSCDLRSSTGSDEDLVRYADQLGMEEESEEETDDQEEDEDSEEKTSDSTEEPAAPPHPQEDSSR